MKSWISAFSLWLGQAVAVLAVYCYKRGWHYWAAANAAYALNCVIESCLRHEKDENS